MSTLAQASQHAWIYAVLIEMNDYCRNEGLDEVSTAITQAIERMEPVVFPRQLTVQTATKPRRVSPFSSRSARESEVVPFPFRD